MSLLDLKEAAPYNSKQGHVTGIADSERPWEQVAGTPTGISAWSEQDAEELEVEVGRKLDLSQVRSFLTEPRPAMFGDVLITQVWLLPVSQPVEEGSTPDRQRQWEARQERRELRVLRESPAQQYDGQTEHYWDTIHEVLQQARESANQQAIIDPYTELVEAFAGVDLNRIADFHEHTKIYGHEADALLGLGRAYVVTGRLKRALGAFRAAVKMDPQCPDGWWHLGVAHLLTRSNAKAAKALLVAADQSPGDFRAEMALALAEYHLKNYPSAEEHFKRLSGGSGRHLAARSLLACSLRMQGNWDAARVELGFLRQSPSPHWCAVADQCLDCVERGEQKQGGKLQNLRKKAQLWKSLAAAGAGGVWMAYAAIEDLFKKQTRWAVIPVFLAALALAHALRGISGREMPGEFGNAEQGLPCWQATTWIKARRVEI